MSDFTESLEAKYPQIKATWPGRNKLNIYQKLNEARTKFHEIKLEKTGRNTFANYNYFTMGDFLIPALKVFKEAGLCAVVSFEREIATMKIIDSDKPEDCITLTSPMGSALLKGCHEVQNIGAVETYQRRYLWTAALEIVEHDALDATVTTDEKGIPATFRSSATMGAFDMLPADEKDFIRDLGMELVALIKDGKGTEAVTLIESHNMDDTQKMGLWSLLDSKTRAAIKKAQATMREAVAA